MTGLRVSLYLLLTITAANASESFWPNSATPRRPAVVSEKSSITLGLEFYAEVPGSVTAVRFYKGKQNKGTHTGNLWSNTGSKLAEVLFTGETETGWQQANFQSPIHIDANARYVISYVAPNGAYASDENFPWAGITASPLRVSGVSPGKFAYGSGSSFPSATQNAANYWVDLIFVPDSPSPSPLYNISGAISPSSTAAGATLMLAGPVTMSVAADTAGNYSFAGLANGTYTVTPTKPGVVFSPASRTLTINGANVSANFAATGQTWNISGAVTPSSLGAGTTVALSGAATAQVTADPSGNYSLTNLANGTYTVIPRKPGVVFSPASQTLTINGANVSATFAATAETWNISGTVNGSAATLSVSGAAAATTTTDSTGNYNFIGLVDGSYVVVPSQPGYTFTPSTALVTIHGGSVSGIAFTAQPAQPSVALSWVASTSVDVTGYNVYRADTIDGPYTKLNTSLIAGLSYIDSTVSGGVTYFYAATAVDSNGNESTYSAGAAAIVPLP